MGLVLPPSSSCPPTPVLFPTIIYKLISIVLNIVRIFFTNILIALLVDILIAPLINILTVPLIDILIILPFYTFIIRDSLQFI